MSQQLINLGSVANDGTGSPLRTGGQDINANFSELYASKVTANPMEATYGAVGDGVANDTIAVQSALTAAAGGTCWIPAGKTFLVNQLSISAATRISGPGTIKIASTFSIGISDGVLYCTAPVVIEDITIDGNSKGRAGITLATGADASIVQRVTIKNVTDAADSGSTGGIIVAATECTILDCTFLNLVYTSAQANASMPRCVSFNSGSTGSVLRGLRGDTVNVVAVVAAAHIRCFDTVVDGAANDGFYCLSASTDVLIDGGHLHNVAEAYILEGANPTVRNLVLSYDAAIPAGPGGRLDQSPSNVLIENVRVYAPTIVCAFLNTRSGTGTVSGLTVRNCHHIGGVDSSACLLFSSGTVNGLRVEGCYFEAHQLATIVGEGRFVTHTTGDGVYYRDNTFRLVDDEGTLTNSNIFRVTFPTLSALSTWGQNLLITDPSHQCQILAGVATSALFSVVGHPTQLQASAAVLREWGFNGNVAQKRLESNAVPSAGTWEQGDIVFNTTPSELGTGGSKYVVLAWTCTVAGTPGTWLQCRALTGN